MSEKASVIDGTVDTQYTIGIGEQTSVHIRTLAIAGELGGSYSASPFGRALLGGLFACSSSAARALVSNAKLAHRASHINEGWMKLGSDHYYLAHEYRVTATQLPDFTTWLVGIKTVQPKYIFGDDHAAMEAYLLSDAYTTPILSQWVPAIIEEMVKRKYMRSCSGRGIRCYRVEMKNEELDDVVSSLVRSRKVRIVSGAERRVSA